MLRQDTLSQRIKQRFFIAKVIVNRWLRDSGGGNPVHRRASRSHVYMEDGRLADRFAQPPQADRPDAVAALE